MEVRYYKSLPIATATKDYAGIVKIGDGISVDECGVISADSVDIVQTTGQSTTSVMSQKAVTNIIGDVETILNTLNSGNGAQ